jgi:N-acetylmuramoyl-L-alanine amidase
MPEPLKTLGARDILPFCRSRLAPAFFAAMERIMTRLMKPVLISLGAAAVLALMPSCSSTSARAGGWDAALGPVPETKITPVEMLKEINLQQDMIAKGTAGRRYFRPMQPAYITIHATENPTGNAYQHALALKRGALTAPRRPGGNRIGFLTWHFTVQDNTAIQHLPTNEQGEHADFDGPGNNFSIGMEMCEHHGNNLPKTIDNEAKLAAYLMYEHHIPLSHVVPHYHWRRIGVTPEHKNCPHFLLEDGRPGATWNWFLNRVQAQYNRLTPGQTPRI